MYAQKTYPVDAVYTWVDGNDSNWKAKKSAALRQHLCSRQTQQHKNAISSCRFIENDELRYSLRSLELYAPWIRNVYIVTDGQRPKWLKHGTANIISHKEIFPPGSILPTFSNRPIELCLHRIDGLSEHFLYLNDDFMFGNHTHIGDFFAKSGKPFIWVVKRGKKYVRKILSQDIAQTSPHRAGEMNAHNWTFEKFNRYYPYRIRHYPKAMTRSIMNSIWDSFPNQIQRTMKTQFRTINDLSICALFPLYAIASGLGKARRINGLQYAFDSLHGRIRNISCCLGDKDFEIKIRQIKKLKPLTFCLNDCEDASQNSRKILTDFLETSFPHKSSFEI